MPTNNERRIVAARLRRLAPGSDWPNMVAEACGLNPREMSNCFHDFTDELCDRIAELIEPEPERTCKPHGEWERTSQLQECRRVLCDCGHELGMDTRRGFPIKIVDFCELPNYCPNCGAKVVE